MTQLEQTLRSQRSLWKETTTGIGSSYGRDLPPKSPKRLFLFGVGSSHHAARLCGYTLIRGGYRVPVIACSSNSIGVEFTPSHEDWAIAFSHRGKTAVTLQALSECERRGAFTLLVGGREIQDPPGVRFVLKCSPMEKVEPHTQSLTTAICAVTSLLLGARAIDEWERLSEAKDPDLEELKRELQQPPALILGEWEGEWLAREGALKLMEMARVPVRAYSTEEFFHGPRYGTSAKDVIWHVAFSGDQRTGELTQARVFKAEESSPLSWVNPLVELQWAALAVALNRGLSPDF